MSELEAPVDEAVDEQFAFDVSDFPGGARSAIEAVLMVVDEPITGVGNDDLWQPPCEDPEDETCPEANEAQ